MTQVKRANWKWPLWFKGR